MLPDGEAATAMELTQGQLHVEQRQPAQDQHDAIGDEEGSAAIFVANIREAPDISQVHRKSDDCQQELGLLTPVLSGRIRGDGDLHNAVLVQFGRHLLGLQRVTVFGGRRVCLACIAIVIAPIAVRVMWTRLGEAVGLLLVRQFFPGLLDGHCGSRRSDGTTKGVVSIRRGRGSSKEFPQSIIHPLVV